MQNMQHEKTFSKLDKLAQLANIKISACRTFHRLEDNPLYSVRFTEVEKFHLPGFAPVYDESGGYHIDLDGVASYKQRFDKTFGFYCNRAAVMNGGKYYHIDPQGNRVYENSYDWVGNYQENKCVVRRGDKFFHIDLEGNKIYQEEYDYIGDFKDDIAVVYKNQNASHINGKGDLIHNKWYKKLGIFHKGYANAEDNRGWFHINIKGQPIYEHRYKMVEPFYNGYAKAETFSGDLGQIDTRGNMRYIIYKPDAISQMHQISREMVGFWNTYLFNATAQMGLLQLLPASTALLAEKLNLNKTHLYRFLRALWEINLISYNKAQDIWQLEEKGQFFIDNPFMFKAAKMWGRVVAEENWLKIPALLARKEIFSFLSFKENEQDNNIRTELYQTLLGYTSFDINSFEEKIEIDKNNRVLLFGVHSLALVSILNTQGINAISYYNAPELPEQLIKDFDIDIRGKNDAINGYDTAIFGRLLQHQDDHNVLSYFKNVKNNNISRILLIETIIEEDNPSGGVVDINIMVETGGKLRTKKDWENLLRQVGDFDISKISALTSYLSVMEIDRK